VSELALAVNMNWDIPVIEELHGAGILFLFDFAQDPVRYQRLHVTHCVDCPAEMTPIVNQGVAGTAEVLKRQ
jgi:hypothetical protein